MPRHPTCFDYPKGIHFSCTRCALCCGDTDTRVRHVLLLQSEAEQVSEVTSKPIDKFAMKIKNHEPYVYEMKKTKRPRKCIFLKENACTIYESRPLICRFYPFQLEKAKDMKYEFTYTKECPGTCKGNDLGENYFENLFQQASERLRKNGAED